MRVEIVRRGGFGGYTVRGTLDTGTLEPRQAAEAESLLRGLPFGRHGSAPRYPDSFTYQLTVHDEGDEPRTVELDETELPDELRALVQPHLDC